MHFNPQRGLNALVLALCTAAFASCDEATDAPTPVPTSVNITTTNPLINSLGGTLQLNATVNDQNGSTISSASVTWTHQTGTVATVSTSGLATAVANGTETITATSGALTKTVVLTVAQAPAAVVLAQGEGQTGAVGQMLPTSLIGTINDGLGSAVAGVDVTFAVATGGGSLSTTTTTTDAMGQATSDWTLGSVSGTQTVSLSLTSNALVSGIFSATATPGAAATLTVESGDQQDGLTSSALADPIVAKVVDAFNNGVPGVTVDFTTTDGSMNPTSAQTDASGQAQTIWTLGPTPGAQAGQVASGSLINSPIAVTANAQLLSVTSISPNPMIEGQSAVITGTGFDITPANNVVSVGSTNALVTAATSTTITFTVPTFDCKAAQGVDVAVMAQGSNSTPLNHPFQPANTLAMAVGQQLILQSPNAYCLQFGASAGSELYLLGVQSVSEAVSTLTSVTLTGQTAAGGPIVVPPPIAQNSFAMPTNWFDTPQQRRFADHAEAHERIRDLDRRNYERLRNSARRSAPTPVINDAIIPVDAMVGDQFLIRVFDRINGTTCADFVEINTQVRAVGTNSIWLEDLANPASGYSLGDFQALATQFDTDIHPPDVALLGNPTDIDANQRTVIVITKEINKEANLLGFVISCDLFLRSAGAASSNEGEFFYGKAPDPTGSVGSTYSVASALADAPFVIAHEFAHVIQQSRRMTLNQNFMDRWMAEGQATFAEEVVGHAVEGRTSGTDLGFDEAFNLDDPNTIDWYSNAFVDMYRYYGFISNVSKLADAPHECSWLDNPPTNPDPCSGGRKVYGVPWSLMRYISDRFAGSYPGGIPGIHQDMINQNVNNGYAVLRDILATAGGPSLETVLAQWAATLYVDGRYGGMPAELSFPSWNLTDVLEGTGPGGEFLPATVRLVPNPLVFTDFASSFDVRAASSYYGLIGGGARPAVAIRARDNANAPLPSHMQFWVVRVQ